MRITQLAVFCGAGADVAVTEATARRPLFIVLFAGAFFAVDLLPTRFTADFFAAFRPRLADFFAAFFAAPRPVLFAAELAELFAAFFAARLAARFDFAQRARCAAAIRSRASLLSGRRPPPLSAGAVAGTLPVVALPAPASNSRTCWSSAISASNSVSICLVSMYPPPLRITQLAR